LASEDAGGTGRNRRRQKRWPNPDRVHRGRRFEGRTGVRGVKKRKGLERAPKENWDARRNGRGKGLNKNSSGNMGTSSRDGPLETLGVVKHTEHKEGKDNRTSGGGVDGFDLRSHHVGQTHTSISFPRRARSTWPYERRLKA